MKLASNLWKSRNGIYYIRFKSIDCDIRRSLDTRDPNIAKILAYQFNSAKSVMNPDDLLKKLKSGNVKDWNIKSSSDGSFEIETDGSQQDHENAISALTLILQSRNSTAQSAPAKLKALDSPTLSKCVADYLIERKGEISDNTIRTYDSSLRKLLKWFGPDVGIQTITNEGFVAFRKTLDATMSLSTVGHDCVAARNMFDWAIERGRYTGNNPVSLAKQSSQVKAKLQEERGEPRNPFDLDDLNKIFDQHRYSTVQKPCAFWLPILGLFTGARIDELCSVALDDVFDNESTPYLKIRSSKTSAGIRDVPIHPYLIEAGFLQYVRDVRALKPVKNMIFPHLVKASKNGYANLAGRDFTAMKQTAGLTKDKVFHSFRKTLVSCLQWNQCPAEMRRIFVGHANNEGGRDVHLSVYSKAEYSPEKLAELVLPFLDYSKWIGFDINVISKYSPNRFDGYLRRMLAKHARK